MDQAREEDHARISPWSCWAEKTWPAAGSVCRADMQAASYEPTGTRVEKLKTAVKEKKEIVVSREP